jgi:ATP-dependent helicase/nuclease subunit A
MPDLTQQQRQAAESTKAHGFVSAGAGCGKTMVLVERYLQVLKQNPESGVQNIIAVTFTRKAAEEMRSRIKEQLRKLSHSDSEQAARWMQLLADVDRARIGTIHSLCEHLLRTYPAEAHVDPQFEVLDDLTKAQMLEDCLDGALNDLFANADENAALLLEYPVEKLKEWMTAQLTAAPQYREARGRVGETLEQMRASAQAIVGKAQSQLLQAVCQRAELRRAYQYLVDNPFEPSSPLEEKRLIAVQCLRRFFAAAENNKWTDMDAALREWAATDKPRTAGGEKGKPLRAVMSPARKIADDFAKACPAMLTEEDEKALVLLQSLLRLIDDALSRFEVAKRHGQKLDYNDMIVKAHGLLKRPDSPARRLIGANLTAVLVDEFQDTNRIQSELLCALCGPETRLFLIGDDKQSIYKFQGADVSNFNEWKRKIGEGTHGLPGSASLFDLDVSFRSHPSVVEFVNRFFKEHFSLTASDAAHGATFQALHANRNDTQSPEHVEVVLYEAVNQDTQKPDASKAREIESRAIATWILEKLGSKAQVRDKKTGEARPIEFGDIAILVQSNNDFGLIEPALADAGIPYVTFAGGGFLKRQEIVDIQNLLRFLANQANDHALLAVLRSPFFSINDALLHRIFTNEQGVLWQKIQTASRKEQFEILRRPVAILKQLLQDSHKLSTSELTRNAIVLTGFDVSLLAVPNGKQKSRNVWKFADFARQYDHLPLNGFVSALESLREMDAGKQSDAPLSAENSVKLMTIHKSKGLEFAAVILPVLGRKVNIQHSKLLVHREYGLSLDTSRTSDDPKPAFFRAAQIIDNEMDAQEKKRLFYVAMTRARDWLVMFVQQNGSKQLSFSLWLAAALNLFPEDGVIGSLQADAHYKTRFVDEDGLAIWEADVRRTVPAADSEDEMEALAAHTDFSLARPLHLNLSESDQPSAWQKLRRATARPTDEPHPTLIGDLFHATMQQRIHGLPVGEAQMMALIRGPQIAVVDAGLSGKLVEACSRMLSLYEVSDLAQIVQTARRIFSETDYTTFSDESSQEKRPDLILQDQNGQWHIIDFKSDKVTEKDVPAKINEHASQVLGYVKDFAALTDQQSRAWIYFAELGKLGEITGQAYDVSKGGQLKLPLLQE